MKVTVISPCYKRFKKYEEVLKGWLSQKEVDEVIVLDNSGTFKTSLPVKVVSVTENMGPIGKYALALWAKNELVVFADDDIFVQQGLVKDLLKYWKMSKKPIAVGIYGKVLSGKTYYGMPGIWAADIKTPVKVDYLGGGCALVDSCWCSVPIRGCPPIALDDLWWNANMKDMVDFYVVPTKKYKFLKEYYHAGLHVNPRTRELREEYCVKWGFI